MKILSVDIGTTAMKMGVFQNESDIRLIRQFSQSYSINTYNDGMFCDIEPEKWQQAFVAGCKDMDDLMPDIDIIALSGTTPGLVAMNKEGEALYPAILMLDQRSKSQARDIISTIGLDKLLSITANMPVSGGCSLSSILWIKDSLPEVYNNTYIFGHSNTFMARWLSDKFAMDPSSASLTAMYNTATNDMNWSIDIIEAFGLSVSHLPELMPAYHSTGRVKGHLAQRLGLKKEPTVLIGGNDAVLAAFSIGIREAGEIFNMNGTCEITMICLSKCLPSRNYNIRTHILHNRWFSFFVMNAGGKAFEWFKSLFCSEMTDEAFFEDFMPRAIDIWLEKESGISYIPYLMGSRYSFESLKAEYRGLTPETTREEMLAALIRGLCEYQQKNLIEISREIQLKNEIIVSGGAVNKDLIRAKTKWMRNCKYRFENQSSLKGAALLSREYIRQYS